MRDYLLVGIGGAAGATLRWGVAGVVPHDDGTFPWATLIVNVLGCAAIGFAAPRIARRADR
jgi:CrcB protein